MTRTLSLTLFLSLLLLPLAPLRADQMVPLAVEDLATRAELVLRGKVVSKTVRRDAENRIYTQIDLSVTEVWKGNLTTNHFTLVHGGGILGDEGVTISGQVEYDVGEEVVVFLVLNAQGEGISIGLSQGKFHLWKDPATGELLAHNRFHGLAGSTPAVPVSKILQPDKPIRNHLTVADLKQIVAGGGK